MDWLPEDEITLEDLTPQSTKYQLRGYQSSAVEAAINWIKYCYPEHGYITAPGGSGKSVIIAKLAEAMAAMGKRVIILARNEKLLTQNRAKLNNPNNAGIYCSGLGEKDLSKPITIASIQSIANVDTTADLILCDECQNIHPDSEEETQYWDFFKRLNLPQIIGFTATPFRTTSGIISWGKEIFNIQLKPLIEKGYIVPPTNKVGASPNLEEVQVRLGEYVLSQLEDVFLDPKLMFISVEKIKQYSENRHSVLIFTQSRKHAKVLQQALADNNMYAQNVDGETSKDELHQILDEFEHRQFQYLINVNLLTEGYDAPNIDMVVVLRSTVSKGLWEQMLYRGTRPYPDKKDFLLLDMGGNLMKHGALGSPYKEKSRAERASPEGKICPVCEEFVASLVKECVACHYQFPEPEVRKVDHYGDPDTESDTVYDEIKIYNVRDVLYRKHQSKNGNICLRVDYICNAAYGSISEYLSPFSSNEWAQNNAWQFFKKRGVILDDLISNHTMESLIEHAQALKKPLSITVEPDKKNPKYSRITNYNFNEKTPITENFTLNDETGF